MRAHSHPLSSSPDPITLPRTVCSELYIGKDEFYLFCTDLMGRCHCHIIKTIYNRTDPIVAMFELIKYSSLSLTHPPTHPALEQTHPLDHNPTSSKDRENNFLRRQNQFSTNVRGRDSLMAFEASEHSTFSRQLARRLSTLSLPDNCQHCQNPPQ